MRDFWNSEACGERYGEEQEAMRYRLEPEILEFADFKSTAGKRVLEVGVGMGTDFLNFVRAGAIATGVDFTERAVGITRQRLEAEGLSAELRIADAEYLPFQDGSFDLVYSWGVLHHTPDTAQAMRELQRVLAPGGRLKVMLYHRFSWVAIAAWVRFCLLRGRLLADLHEAVTHVESPGTKAFTEHEVRRMLVARPTSIAPVLTHWDRKFAPGLTRAFGDRFGWFLLVQATAD